MTTTIDGLLIALGGGLNYMSHLLGLVFFDSLRLKLIELEKELQE